MPFAAGQVVSTGPTPEWDEAFAWAFDSPPKGQKLHISCKNKSKLGKVEMTSFFTSQVTCKVLNSLETDTISFYFYQSSFGKVTIQIDRVVMLGSVSGEYTLLPESKSGPRNLEIEFQWSNK